MAEWRQFGWQQMEFAAPSDWFLQKIGTERSQGELWLAEAGLPRLQIKWLDATKQKSVNPTVTLERFLEQMERQAKKAKVPFASEREIKLVGRAGRDVGSMECFTWRADIESYGLIWYSRQAGRVTLAQVNGRPGEPGLKKLARQVLSTLDDAPEAPDALWTAYDLACRVPVDFQLTGQTMETGHTMLKFTRREEILTIERFGLASIALSRAEDLGDWAFRQRHKQWFHYRLNREEHEHRGYPAVTFTGHKRGVSEQVRYRGMVMMRRRYPLQLTGRVWHCDEANCLYLLDQIHDPRSPSLVAAVSETIPCQPEPVPEPRG